jgi:cytochrome c biogenesis protein CcdA
VVLFTLALKATTALLGVPQFVWQVVAGGIVALFGATLLFPRLWEGVMAVTGLQNRANAALDRSYRRGGLGGDILLGAVLGPTFSSCSPTYALILATVLPTSFAEGLAYIVVYAIGLAMALLMVALLGQAFARKLGWLSSPSGWFRRTVGILLVVVGLAVIMGLDKQLQAFVLEQGWYDPIRQFEEGITG